MKSVSILATMFLLIFTMTSVVAQDKPSKADASVIYSYKKYEKFDLGNLEIQGSVVTPGDLSVKERSRKTFERKLLNRSDFFPEIQQDILKIR